MSLEFLRLVAIIGQFPLKLTISFANARHLVLGGLVISFFLALVSLYVGWQVEISQTAPWLDDVMLFLPQSVATGGKFKLGDPLCVFSLAPVENVT